MSNNWKRNVVLFLTSQTISLFGSSLVQYAIMWHITLSTQSGVMMTIAIICGFLPTFFISPFAGVWADRFNRKNLIIISDSLIAISTLVLAILFLMGYQSIWLLFAMSSIRALGAGIQMPAVGAFIPQIAPADKLTKVNAINGSVQSFIMIISPMLSGALLTLATIEVIFFIDVVTAAIAVSVLLLFLNVSAHAKALDKQTISYFADMREGINYIKEHEYVKRFFLFCTSFFLLVAPVAFLTPLQVTRSFGDDVWRLTVIEISFALGMMMGGGIMATWSGFKNKVHTMTLAFLITGACTFALGIVPYIAPYFWLYLIFMIIAGVSMPMFNTPSMVLLQVKVEESYLGRVFGVLGMISSTMMPLGMLIFGPIADIVEIEWLLIITGVLLFVQGFFLIGSKVLVEAGKPQTATEQE